MSVPRQMRMDFMGVKRTNDRDPINRVYQDVMGRYSSPAIVPERSLVHLDRAEG